MKMNLLTSGPWGNISLGVPGRRPPGEKDGRIVGSRAFLVCHLWSPAVQKGNPGVRPSERGSWRRLLRPLNKMNG